ncbi:unnamed protein product [Vicia faba]|uniref:Uncharacterized protein n=1 Tax=Vicia faba TaxID=3906 RepID=A0AAV1B8U4_VICFA|nr:unnamed protein product [Vicia faba]
MTWKVAWLIYAEPYALESTFSFVFVVYVFSYSDAIVQNIAADIKPFFGPSFEATAELMSNKRARLVSSFETSLCLEKVWFWMQGKTWGGKQEQFKTDLWSIQDAKVNEGIENLRE